MLPNYLLIGVQKGGTTSTQYTFNKHPEIYIAPNEIHFFDGCYKNGIEWYKSQFKAGHQKHIKAVGEKTPRYVFLPQCINRIHRHIPNAKLIVMLRDPVKRFFSQLNMIHGNVSQQRFDRLAIVAIRERSDVLTRGFYIDQLQYVLSKFPQKQLYIAISEHVKENPTREYNKMFEFLGVSTLSHVPSDTSIHKRLYRNRASPDIQDQLVRIYKPYNLQLFKFLGFEISSWL